MRRVRSKLTFANVCSFLALLIAIGTGSAYAANTVFSSDIVNDEVYSADVRNDTLAGGGLAAVDLRSNAVGSAEIVNGGVRSADVQDGSLSGLDVAENSLSGNDITHESVGGGHIQNGTLTGQDVMAQSGVDNCTHGSVRFGELCVGVANLHQSWLEANDLCASLELRLPSLGEAQALAENYNITNVNSEYFWTEESFVGSGGFLVAWVVNDADPPQVTVNSHDNDNETVCVTTPTN